MAVIPELPPQKSYKALFLIFPILLAAVFGTYLYATVGNGNGNGTGNSLACTQLFPDSAQFNFFANSTVAGTYVTSSNGTNTFFPAGACPQPVHQALSNAIANVTTKTQLSQDENGTQFTVDSVNSLGSPLTAANGSMYEALIFNHLNLSDPIFPCNLNEVYRNPIAQIDVYIPVLSNGSLVYANSTIITVPGSALQFNCPQETGLTTFSKSQIPQQFTVGGFSFNLIFNGTNYVTNGTSYLGFDYAFNVTYTAPNVTQIFRQTVVFNWPSAQSFASNVQPTPFIATPFDSYVVMRWYVNSTLYLTVTTLA